MAACPACGFSNPETAKFCMDCGRPLEAAARPVAEVTEQRRVVTIVFGDLVGFTARSETLDPEDVRAFLVPYYDLLTEEIERHGGVVDKLLGDGVMAVFGAPVAHEDDPERAVRMALRVLERLPGLGLDLQLRFGINTGEVVVAVDAFDRGDAITGDAANTAARLQGVAPVGGVVVGERTWGATAAAFEYEELPAASLKGKAEPVRVFRAVASRGRLGIDLLRAPASAFVARTAERQHLTGLFDEVLASGAGRMALVVADPGLGKSRLIAELFAHVDDLPGTLVTWHQGRCLPYGEGITFWALGEIVKAHAGVLESDSPEIAERKLDAVLPDGDDRPWLRARLLPLLGIEASFPAQREELFTAWRRFLEGIARQSPTVLVFEDLHWGDTSLLLFLEHLGAHLRDVPMLVLGTARPELFDRYPAFAAELPDTARIDLGPLSDDETGVLVATLLGADEVPRAVLDPIVEGAGGNPLFAEQFVRLLRDQEMVVRSVDGWALRPGAVVPSPDSVQALIGARLDTLSAGARDLLLDAAVVGKVFWPGSLAAMGSRDPAAVETTLDDLGRREFVRLAARSSIEGEREFSFWHALTRDVAYARLPRTARSSRHAAAARWLEFTTADRLEDVADVLAYHYSTALELAQASRHAAEVAALTEPALRYLVLAGERALGLDAAAALTYLGRAVALAPADHPGRPSMLDRYGQAANDAARYADAVAAHRDAAAAFGARGDELGVGRALVHLVSAMRALGDPDADQVIHRANEVLAPLGPTPERVAALTELAAGEVVNGRNALAVRHAQEALDLAASLGLAPPARALGLRGWARASVADPGWADDFREAIERARAAGQGRELVVLHLYFAGHLSFFEGPAVCLPWFREGLAIADARSLTGIGDWLRLNVASTLLELGELDPCLRLVDELEPRAEASGDLRELAGLRSMRTAVELLRGDTEAAAARLEWLEATAAALVHDLDRTDLIRAVAAARFALGDRDRAAAWLAGIADSEELKATSTYRQVLCPMLRTALQLSDVGLAERLAAGVDTPYPMAEHVLVQAGAMLAEAHGETVAAAVQFADAAARWEAFGVVPERAFSMLGQGRCLLALERDAEARRVLHEARRLFERLGAAPSIADVDALLARPAPAT